MRVVAVELVIAVEPLGQVELVVEEMAETLLMGLMALQTPAVAAGQLQVVM